MWKNIIDAIDNINNKLHNQEKIIMEQEKKIDRVVNGLNNNNIVIDNKLITVINKLDKQDHIINNLNSKLLYMTTIFDKYNELLKEMSSLNYYDKISENTFIITFGTDHYPNS